MDDLQKIKLQRAKKKVETIKNFYKHLVTYILVNLFLTFVWSFKFKIFGDLIFSNQYNSDGFKHIPFWLVLGIFLLFDALKSFGFITIFNNKWEDKKIKEFMKESKNI